LLVTERVSAVVVNYNARTHLLECLHSLRAEGVEEIIVVDNASSDGSLDAVARADPEVVILPTGGNLGFGSAANRGLAVARGTYVAVLNPDVVVESGTMKALTAALDADPTIGAVAPRVDNPDGTLYPSVRAFPSMTEAIGHAFLGFVAPRNRFSRRYRLLDWDH
jgi:N-acetylglucosaminyl-diphospho-decaprenol L-rhamnosyltransferase